MGASDDVSSFVRGNWIRLGLLSIALLLSIIGAGLLGSNDPSKGYDEAWAVLSIVILIIALYLEGRVVLFYIVLGFIYAVLPKFVVNSDTNVPAADNAHSGNALLSAALFLAIFALTPADGWQQFRASFLSNAVGWLALIVFILNFFGCLLIWISVGKNSNPEDNNEPLGDSIFAFLNGLLFLIAYAYKYAHASLLGFLLFTYGGVTFLQTMVTNNGSFSDTARAGAGFICFPNFVFIFIVWRVCVAPLTIAQQSHDANAAPSSNVSGSNMDAQKDTPQASAPPAPGWRATIFSSLVRFAGLAGCLALCIIGLLIIRDTEGQAVIEIAAATVVGLLLVTLFVPAWDYSFIFIYIAVFLLSVPFFVFWRSDHTALAAIDGRTDGEIDSAMVLLIIGTVLAYFFREFTIQRIQRFTLGRDLMWLYFVGIVAEALFIIGLIILFSEASKYTADTTVRTVTVPLVLLLVYFFIQLHLDNDLNHRLVLLFLIAFFLEHDLVAASSNDNTSDSQALRQAGCGLCAIGLYMWQFVLGYLHWNETHSASDGASGVGGGSGQIADGYKDDNIGAGGNPLASGGADVAGLTSNPYQHQEDDAHSHTDEQAHSEAPVQTV